MSVTERQLTLEEAERLALLGPNVLGPGGNIIAKELIDGMSELGVSGVQTMEAVLGIHPTQLLPQQ